MACSLSTLLRSPSCCLDNSSGHTPLCFSPPSFGSSLRRFHFDQFLGNNSNRRSRYSLNGGGALAVRGSFQEFSSHIEATSHVISRGLPELVAEGLADAAVSTDAAVADTVQKTNRDWLSGLTGRLESILKQGSSLLCTTWGRPSVDADDMEARSENDIDKNASANTCRRKEPWLKRLMFGFSKSKKPWEVPWTSFTIIQVMFLWFCTFWLVGSWIIPFAAHYVGCSKDTLTYRGQALYSLITDIAEGTVGLGILHRCLARFQPLPRNWFPFSWRGQWYIDVLLGCLTFPVVNRLSQLNLELLPFPSPLTSSYEQSIMSRDPIASVLYAIVVSVCCPIWEEVIFRGFLLPSLTRYLPMWASIFVSAVVFGLAHFNVQRMLPLTFLGLVMGIMFVRSKNLLSPMLLHSLWNGFVFMGLLR